MVSFVQESLATIRRRLGYLMFRDQFVYDTVLSPTSSTVTLSKAIRVVGGKLVGNTLYLQSGAAAGTLTTVSANEQGTGKITVSPTFAVTPGVGDAVEIWPEGLSPDHVNQFINIAILGAQAISPVLFRATPSVASDRLSVTASASFTKVARLTYKNGTERITLRPRGPSDPQRSDRVFTVNDTTLELDNALPSSATSIQVIGYRNPAFLVNDSDLAEVRSDYLIFRTAELLSDALAKTPALDPEGHSAAALTWKRLADEIRLQLPAQHLSNTHLLETVV